MKATRDDPLALYPRDDAQISAWLKRNGVFFFTRRDEGQPYRTLNWCQCCGYIIPPMHARYYWQSYHDVVGVLLLCSHCDRVAMQNVQETLKKLLAMIREAPEDIELKHDTEDS